MDSLTIIDSDITHWLPVLASVSLGTLIWWVVHRWLVKRVLNGEMGVVTRQVILLTLSLVLVLVTLLLLPIEKDTRNQLIGLLGLVFTTILAFSSTSFVTNAMAGLMLKSINSYRVGDFIRVGEQFGRVSERGLFHTEVQTEERNLTTIPNLFLVTNPVTVVHSAGTIISAEVSLGYDVPPGQVESILLEAIELAGLEDGFVQLTELGDFSIVYRAAGFLPEVKALLTSRSQLRRCMVNRLHEAGVEIVSPSFMNQRVLDPEQRIISLTHPMRPLQSGAIPEELMFDKAEIAEQRVLLESERKRLIDECRALKQSLDKNDADEPKVMRQIAVRKARIARLEGALAVAAESDERKGG